MRRWVWRVLLIVAVMAALTVGAAAAEVKYPASGSNSILYDLDTGTVLGPVNKAAIVNAIIPAEVNGVPITSIGPNAFQGCGILETVEIGKKVVTIGEGAFNTCVGLKHVYFSKNCEVTTIEKDAFAGCSKLNDVILPSQLTVIKAGTFSRCSALDTIYIPANVTVIEATAFYMDTKLAFLHYGDMTKEPDQKDVELRIVHFSLLGHPEELKAATCTVDGKERVVASCEKCGKDIITEEHSIPATGHTPGAEVAEVPANCVETGTKAGKYCTVCKKPAEGLEVIPIDPDTHKTPEANHIDLPTTPATCTKPGSSGGKQCPDCLAVTTDPSEIPAAGHKYDGKKTAEAPRMVQEATCSLKGYKVLDYVCDVCGEVKECKICTDNEDTEVTEAYAAHLNDDTQHASLEVLDTIDHAWGQKDYDYKAEADKPTCGQKGKLTAVKICTVCDEKEWDDNDTKEEEKTDHTPPEGYKEEIIVPGDCETPKKTKYPAYTCAKCSEDVPERIETGTATGKHNWKKDETAPGETIKAATCISDGEEFTSGQICTNCDKKLPRERKPIPKTAHNWGTPVKDPSPGEGKEDKAPTCGEDGVEYVIVACQNTAIGCTETEHRTIILPATQNHNYEGSVWTTVKKPTATENGLEEMPCMNPGCGHKDQRILPATGDPSGPDDPDGPDKPEPAYLVNLVQGAGGSVSSNKSSAKSGDRVTLTIWAESGYELDMIRVVSASGGVPSVTDLGGNQHRFTMPASNVEVRVTFVRKSAGSAWSSSWASAPGDGADGNPRRTTDPMPTQSPAQSVPRAGVSDQLFRDIPASHWAAGEISWANQMGYMNGSGGRFNPDGTITHQQMWMVLARITGSRPANMTEARRWAVENSFADGSSPTGAVARHQLVTALYRCAHLVGSTNRNTTSLAGYTDSRTVPTVARDAFSWAVANGIVGGTANGRLDPNGTLTRAQFAVILYRYSQRI